MDKLRVTSKTLLYDMFQLSIIFLLLSGLIMINCSILRFLFVIVVTLRGTFIGSTMHDITEEEFPTTSHGLHFAHLNVQSTRNKIDMLKIYVSELDFHMFSLSETWFIRCLDNTFLDIPGYNFVRLDRSCTSNGQIAPTIGALIISMLKKLVTSAFNYTISFWNVYVFSGYSWD